MAPLSTDSISHFTHPAHKLNHLTTNSSFLCDGCMLPGTGSRFTCTICSFDLHDYCAMCTTRLTSATNHHHPMSLVVHKPQPNLTQSCQSCRNPIKGLAYVCNNCSFWVHPLCVSHNSGQSPTTRAPSGSASTAGFAAGGAAGVAAGGAAAGVAAAGAAAGVASQVGIGLGTNWLYDKLKEDDNEVHSAASSISGAGAASISSTASNTGGADDSEGILDGIMSGFMSLFESSSS